MKNIFVILFVLFVANSSGQTKFQHTTNSSNIAGNSTFLNAEGLNGNPGAIIIILDFTSAPGVTNPHPVGVWYIGNKWAIFNEDKAPMPSGISFSIAWKNTDANAFFYKAITYENRLNHPVLDNNPGAIFYVTQNWNPGPGKGVYNPEEVIVVYDNRSKKWKVQNRNRSPIPTGAAFNILVLNPGDRPLTPATIGAEAIKNKSQVPAIENQTDIPNLAVVSTYSDARLNHLLTTANEEEIKQYIQSLPFEKQLTIQTETEISMRTHYIASSGKTDYDKDGDGFRSTSAGGNDCDDLNRFSYPGKGERCTGIDIFTLGRLKLALIYALVDEDCDPFTVADVGHHLVIIDGDEDEDGAINCNCKNFSMTPVDGASSMSKWKAITYTELNLPNKMNYKYVIAGVDCDDKNPNIGKEGQVCIAPNKVGMCVSGVWKTFDCKKCVTQPNGSGLVVE